MNPFPPTIILRHRKENLKKCSLRGLEKREDLSFYTYPKQSLPDLTGYILLTLDAPPLEKEDCDRGLFLIDGTWKHAQKMYDTLSDKENLIHRSIPAEIKTAYPRKQTGCSDPERGLATIEALYVAYLLLSRDVTGLLDSYYWKDSFLKNLDQV